MSDTPRADLFESELARTSLTWEGRFYKAVALIRKLEHEIISGANHPAGAQVRYDNKIDAIINAHHVAARGIGPAFAIETINGWIVSDRKPSLRYGKVIECRDGKEYLA